VTTDTLAPPDRQLLRKEHQAMLAWLSRSKSHESVVVILRREPTLKAEIDVLPDGDPAIPFRTSQACEKSLRLVHEQWHEIVGHGTYWSRINCYPELAACTLHGPTAELERLLNKLHESPARPVAGYIYGGFLTTPEAEFGPMGMPDGAKTALKTFASDCFDLGVNNDRRGLRTMVSDSLLAALYDGPPSNNGNADDSPDPIEYLSTFENEWGYLNQLQIGDAASWSSSPGRGQMVCVIDSGADESHPLLQRQVAHYMRFDLYGNEKEAYACMDNACHGTKIAGWIGGKPLDLAQLCGRGTIRLGIAPHARLLVLSSMGGDLLRESGTWDQLLAGLKHAVSLKHRYHHQIVNISMAFDTPKSADIIRHIDGLLADIKHVGIVPILAAGNHGDDSCPLGTNGYYIGALDSQGQPSSKNGKRVDLLAPGDVYCAQPASPRLNHRLFGRHQGSSLAAAIVAGAVALVAAEKRISAPAAMEKLLENAKDGRLWIDGALR
jgi:hypothetical protein